MSFLNKVEVHASASAMVSSLERASKLIKEAKQRIVDAADLANPSIDDKDFIKTLPAIEKKLDEVLKEIYGHGV